MGAFVVLVKRKQGPALAYGPFDNAERWRVMQHFVAKLYNDVSVRSVEPVELFEEKIP